MSDDQCVVRLARVKMALLFVFLLACFVVATIQVWTVRSPFAIEARSGFVRGLEFGVLAIRKAGAGFIAVVRGPPVLRLSDGAN
jgi:hypothetical protein